MLIAMHCNLRPPNIAPVVLDFNYETHNAPLFSNLRRPTCMLRTDIGRPNVNAIEKSAAELLRFKYDQFLAPWIWPEVDFRNSTSCEDRSLASRQNFNKIEQCIAELLTIQHVFPGPFFRKGRMLVVLFFSDLGNWGIPIFRRHRSIVGEEISHNYVASFLNADDTGRTGVENLSQISHFSYLWH